MVAPTLAKTAVLSLLTSLAACLPLNLSSLIIDRRGTSVRQVLKDNFPDPAVFQDGNTWYAFGTNDRPGKNVQVATSPDFEKWSLKAGYEALPHAGAWVDPGNPAVWAPSVIRNDQKIFVMYYSAQAKSSPAQHCIGVATSKSILGPYDPKPDPFVCNGKAGGAIDPSGFLDSSGQRFVLYKIDGNSMGHGGSCGNSVAPIVPTPIMLQRVAGEGIAPIGPPVQILDRSDPDGPLVEAPSLMRAKDGTYVLFFSSNCYSSPLYDVAYAFADHIAGPYVKAGPFATKGTTGLLAPGSAAVTGDGRHLIFHAGPVGSRSLYTANINIDTKKHVVSS